MPEREVINQSPWPFGYAVYKAEVSLPETDFQMSFGFTDEVVESTCDTENPEVCESCQ